MKKFTGAIILSLVMIVSCKNDLSFKKTKGGMPYKVYSGKNGKNLKVGDIIKVQVIQKIKDRRQHYHSTNDRYIYQACSGPRANKF